MILALRALKLGDLLVAVPALRAIRRFWPDEPLVLATSGWLYPITRLARCADQLLPVGGLEPLPGAVWFPDVAINLHGAGPQSNRILDQLCPRQRIGHSGHGWPGPAWLNGIHERERWCRLLVAHGVPADPADLYLDHPPVASPAPGAAVIHPGAAYGSKCWPVDRFAEVARRLAGAGTRIALTGTANEVPLVQAVALRAGLDVDTVLAGRTSLPELAALIADASLVISGDTGTAHLAYAYRTPSVTLFGPAPSSEWGPPPGPHVALSADKLRKAEQFSDEPDPALLGVHPDAVLAAAFTITDTARARPQEP